MIRPSNNLGYASIWVFTLTANSAAAYMLKRRNVSTFSSDSEHFGVSTNILLLFYHATIESLIRYGIVSFYGNLSMYVTLKGGSLSTGKKKPQAHFLFTLHEGHHKVIS